MKKIIPVLLAICLIVGLTACSGGSEEKTAETAEATEAEATETAEATAESTEEAAEETAEESAEEGAEETAEEPAEEGAEETAEEPAEEGATLVVYFSATGTTKGVAEKITSVTGADIYEIKAAQEYTDEDLNWHDDNSRTTHEQNDPASRPEIGSEPVSLDGYTTIYIGYPIWWGEEPRIMDTFVESYNFDGITMIPFCTSGGSGVGRSAQNLADNAGSGNWLEGERLSSSILEDELRSWIEGLE